MPTTRSQVDYAQHKWSVQQIATSLLVQAEEILSHLDHNRIPDTDGELLIVDAHRCAVQLALLRQADEDVAREAQAA